MADGLVNVQWEVPPTLAEDGSWCRTYQVVQLPVHIAETAHPTARVLDQHPEAKVRDLLRVLYTIVKRYEPNGLGRDDEFLRDAMRIGREVLIQNDWWPTDD